MCTRCADAGYVLRDRRADYPCFRCNKPKKLPSKLVHTFVYTKEGQPDVTITKWNNGQFRFENKLYPYQWAVNVNMSLQEQGYVQAE
jgi:hypothetical protein